jgi:HAD superfamily hydrolase (TIGR01484 family)
MKNLHELSKSRAAQIDFVLTDIDDTLTNDGKLLPEAYSALWDLNRAGIKVLPITGRPAGWCEMIARFWPVCGIIGENGGLYFRHHKGKMKRVFVKEESERRSDRKKLKALESEILTSVPGSALASDQFCRMLDLAIDFCEDVEPLEESKVSQIVKTFEAHGAVAKVSSIHVNGWFGKYDKKTMALRFLQEEFQLSTSQIQEKCTFIGDSPNDEPLFNFLEVSVAVANFLPFQNQVEHFPKYITNREGGYGFSEISNKLISARS